MTPNKNSNSGSGDYISRHELRRPAEKKADDMGRMDLNGLSDNDIKGAIHDLRVHQIEEEALKKSEAKYAELVECAYDGVVIVQDEVFKFVNSSWCQITGFSADDVIGRSFTDVIPEDYKEFVSQRHKARLGGENPPPVYDGRILCKDVSIKDVEVSASIIEYEGRPANMALVRDISERKQMENVLTFMVQRSVTGTGGEFFESIAPYLASNLSMDFICIDRIESEELYAKNVVVYCDGRFKDNMVYALKDTPCGDVVGKEVCCFPSGVRQSFPKDEMLKELQAESYVSVSLRAHTGKPIGIIAAIGRRPLTNTRLAENMLKIVGVRAAAELERLDHEERRARLEGELRQAYKMQAIGTLAGGIAHEFNNILAIILGNTEMAILDSPGLNQTGDYLKEIERASIRGRDVVKQLLSFSRIGQVKRTAIKPDKIFTDSLRLIRASIPTSVELRQDIETNIYTILADSTQLNQVIINLCTNARDAMRNRGGVLEVTLKNVDIERQSDKLQPGKYVRLTVSDTGTGINAETIERIFDPYFTTKEVGKGTGMGLAVVHGIVKEHDGVISVETDQGKGSTFHIWFPAVEETPRHGPEKKADVPKGKESIIFVDDEETLVRISTGMLERLGYKVEGKTDPEQALELFRAAPYDFDLVITDTSMPKLTGDLLAQEIIRIRPNMKIIICTGYSELMDEKKAEQLGIKSFIMKPLDLRKLANTVREVLDKGNNLVGSM